MPPVAVPCGSVGAAALMIRQLWASLRLPASGPAPGTAPSRKLGRPGTLRSLRSPHLQSVAGAPTTKRTVAVTSPVARPLQK